MSHLALRLVALRTPDAGDGGGSTVTGTDATEEATSTVTAGAAETKEPVAETKPAGAETKDAPDPKAAAAAIEKAAAALDLKLPEGLDPKDPSVAAFRKLAAEQGLDSPKAQKLFEAHRAELATATKTAIEKHQQDGKAWLDTQRKDWREALKKDTEYGGSKYSETTAAVSRTYNRYGASDPELKAFLNDGAGDHPALVKFLARIGRDLAEDNTALKTKPKNGAASSADAELKAMFPNSKELFT